MTPSYAVPALLLGAMTLAGEACSSSGSGTSGAGATGASNGGAKGVGGAAGSGASGTAGGDASSDVSAGTGGSGATGSGGDTGSAGTGGSSAGGSAGANGGAAGDGGRSGGGGRAGSDGGAGSTGGSGPFELTSSSAPDGYLQQKYYCLELQGSNVSPALEWKNAPEGTASFAIIFLDTANGLYHSAMWDVPSATRALPEALEKAYRPANGPAGMKQSKNTRDQYGYQGPCPTGTPVKDRIYKFTLYALSAPLSGLDEASTKDEVNRAATSASALGTTALTLKVNTF